ncbi:HdeD family acid-resistance protein, partial [Microbacterium sp. CPCC 204701]|uniref:HdeD family acid-resistance protein n=1 Tax=Microbacterium sp. CPCC 204701 TaxID=2493084 RepID=UPI001F0C7D9A
MIREARRARAAGWSIAPRLVGGAPPVVLVVVGALSLLVGLLIVTRPLTSLLLLTVYVGLSAVFAGVARFLSAPDSPLWSRVVFGAVWVVLGLAVLIGLGRTLDLLPELIAVLLVLGGLASLYDALARGRISQRILAAAWGAAQMVFGVLAFAWPDVTVLIVAIVFGVRTIVFGATLLVQALRAFVAGRRSVGAAEMAVDAVTADGTDAEGAVSSTDAGAAMAVHVPARTGSA